MSLSLRGAMAIPHFISIRNKKQRSVNMHVQQRKCAQPTPGVKADSNIYEQDQQVALVL